MKGIKNSFGLGIAAFLLLCFSVTVLPLDAFHSHAESSINCNDATSTETCQHKQHINTENAFCAICAIHHDNSFTGKTTVEKIALSPGLSLFVENEFTGYFIQRLFSALRGPPLK